MDSANEGEATVNSQHQEQGTRPDNQDDDHEQEQGQLQNQRHTRKDDTKPRVLHPTTLPAFIQHILDTHAPPTTLVICASRATFLQHLLHACKSSSPSPSSPQPQPHNPDTDPAPHNLLLPTLHLLSTSRTITLVFCPSLQSLRAYLSVHPSSKPSQLPETSTLHPPPPSNHPLLALLNPIALHRETTSFSAQGLSRTMAAAVEAAERAGQRLVVGESAAVPATGTAGESAGGRSGDVDVEEDVEKECGHEAAAAEPATRHADAVNGHNGPATTTEPPVTQTEAVSGADAAPIASPSPDAHPAITPQTRPADPWAEEISILNVATKSFGVGERGWVGRTVSLRRVFEQWCVFEGVRVKAKGERK